MRAPLAARSSGSAWQRLCVAATFATLVCVAAPAEAQTVVTVSDATPLQTLDALYQGYNIDSGSLYNGIALDTDVLVQLTRNLAPA